MNRISCVAGLLLGLSCVPSFLSAQDSQDFYNMSIEDLIQVEIKSVSGREEQAFSASMDSSVLTRDQIVSSGATSIPDALRLLPGLIVKELANGTYEVYIRGLDGAYPQSPVSSGLSSNLLVTLDGRIVYSYFTGGTFWETLPVSIDQVEKIEVVRGPMSPLYGPNAAQGVIAIFSRNSEKAGWQGAVNTLGGGSVDAIGDLRVNSQLFYQDTLFRFELFQQHEQRQRHQNSFYSVRNQQYQILEELREFEIPGGNTMEARFYRPEESVHLDSVMGRFVYEPEEGHSYLLSAGFQDSAAYHFGTPDNVAPFSSRRSHTYFVNTDIRLDDLEFHADWNAGNQGNWLVSNQTDENPAWTSVGVLDTYLVYTAKIQNLTLRPQTGYREAMISAPVLRGPGFNSLNSYFAALRAEYDLNNLNFVAAVRYDNYSPNREDLVSYNMSALWKMSESANFRVSHGRSFRTFFIFDTFVGGQVEPMNGPFFEGSSELNPFTVDTTEAGVRLRHKDVTAELTAFYTGASDQPDFSFEGLSTTPGGRVVPVLALSDSPLELRNYGLTASLTYLPHETFTLRLFGTLQESRFTGSAPDRLSQFAGIDSIPRRNSMSPPAYGGIALDYSGIEKWLFHSSVYVTYYGDHFYSGFSNPDGTGVDAGSYLDDNALLALNVQYILCDGLLLNARLRNLSLTGAKRQFTLADNIDPTLYFGANFRF